MQSKNLQGSGQEKKYKGANILAQTLRFEQITFEDCNGFKDSGAVETSRRKCIRNCRLWRAHHVAFGVSGLPEGNSGRWIISRASWPHHSSQPNSYRARVRSRN